MSTDFWQDRPVFITGHTGFKGSWLSLWLSEMGAKVTGYALAPDTTPNHWDLLRQNIADNRGDIRDYDRLSSAISEAQPEIVFHLAAQPLVRRSYRDPLETWSTNVMGTAHVLEACRNMRSIRAIVVATTDKVYANEEWPWGYRENDRLGGHDPYSASKASCEILVDSYRKSFFQTEAAPLLASARAGNVIGGGDWADDRLVPDLVRAVSRSQPLDIRNPDSTRPWQHVLDCLSGYLLVGRKLLKGDGAFAEAWNFGPDMKDNMTVGEVVNRLQSYWSDVQWQMRKDPELHEAGMLYLDNSKSKLKLGWRPVWSLDQSIKATAQWYESFHKTGTCISRQQLSDYMRAAQDFHLSWSAP